MCSELSPFVSPPGVWWPWWLVYVWCCGPGGTEQRHSGWCLETDWLWALSRNTHGPIYGCYRWDSQTRTVLEPKPKGTSQYTQNTASKWLLCFPAVCLGMHDAGGALGRYVQRKLSGLKIFVEPFVSMRENLRTGIAICEQWVVACEHLTGQVQTNSRCRGGGGTVCTKCLQIRTFTIFEF